MTDEVIEGMSEEAYNLLRLALRNELNETLAKLPCVEHGQDIATLKQVQADNKDTLAARTISSRFFWQMLPLYLGVIAAIAIAIFK